MSLLHVISGIVDVAVEKKTHNFSKINSTTESHMLTSAQQTCTILSNRIFQSPGDIKKYIACVALRYEYFFLIFPITRDMNVGNSCLLYLST